MVSIWRHGKRVVAEKYLRWTQVYKALSQCDQEQLAHEQIFVQIYLKPMLCLFIISVGGSCVKNVFKTLEYCFDDEICETLKDNCVLNS